MQKPGASTRISIPLAQQSIGNITTTGGSKALIGNTINGNVYINDARSSDDPVKICEEALFQTFPSASRDGHGKPVPGTCEWIKEKDEYQSWFSRERSLLWIHGNPGRGKTFLSIFLIQELERQSQNSCGSDVIYFFCSSQDSRRNNAASILRGLLFQLVTKQRHLASLAVQYFNTPGKAQESVSSRDILWTIVEHILQSSELKTTFCVLDGLDECDEASQQWLSSKITELGSSNAKFHLLVASRDIHWLRGVSPQIDLDSDNDEHIQGDIERFISFKLQDVSVQTRLTPQTQEAVQKQMLQRSEGTFLWVGLAMNELQSCRTTLEIERTLNSLPAGLGNLFARMLQQIRPDYKEDCAKMLMWVTLADRPLYWMELAAALGTNPTPLVGLEQAISDMVTMCRFVVKETPLGIMLVHQSAREYLLQSVTTKDTFLKDFGVDPDEAHLQIAWTCLDIIARCNLRDAPLELERSRGFVLSRYLRHQHELLVYAVDSWMEHAAYSNQVAERLLHHPSNFFRKKSPLRHAWWMVFYELRSLHISLGSDCLELPPLHQACYLGLSSWARVLIQKDSQLKPRAYQMLNKNDPYGKTPLHHAISKRHLDTVRLLLETGANIELKDHEKATAFDSAVSTNQYEVVRLMINTRPDIARIPVKEGHSAPIHNAAQFGRYAIVQLLLDAGAPVDSGKSHTWTPLYTAVFYGHSNVAKMLLDRGADVNFKEHMFGCSPLHEAARRGDEGMTRLLLDQGADINIRSEYLATPVREAAEHDNWRVIQLLLDRGAEVDAMARTRIDSSLARRKAGPSAQ